MSKKFVIIAPTICCGNSTGIGNVYVSAPPPDFEVTHTECSYCHKQKEVKRPVYTIVGVKYYCIEESLIVWLPDDDDKIRFEKEEDIEGVV